MDRDVEVPKGVAQVVAEMTSPRPMRRGSLSERYMKCNRAGCGCGDKPEARHGPYYSLTRAMGGRTQSRLLDAETAERVRRQIEAGQEFRKRVETYWEACEKWADAELEAVSEKETAKKGGSKKSSRLSSPKKSKRW